MAKDQGRASVKRKVSQSVSLSVNRTKLMVSVQRQNQIDKGNEAVAPSCGQHKHGSLVNRFVVLLKLSQYNSCCALFFFLPIGVLKPLKTHSMHLAWSKLCCRNSGMCCRHFRLISRSLSPGDVTPGCSGACLPQHFLLCC